MFMPWALTFTLTLSPLAHGLRGPHHISKEDDTGILKEGQPVLDLLSQRGWTLPVPKSSAATEFGSKHQCQARREEPLKAFFQSSAWMSSSERVHLRRQISKASANYTLPVLVTLFEPRDGDGIWFVRSYACHARRIGMQPLVVVFSESAKELVDAHPPLLGVSLPLLTKEVGRAFGLDDIDAGDGVDLMKWPAALATLEESAPAAFVSDIDVLWLQDPRRHVMSFGDDVDVAVSLDSQPEFLSEPDSFESVEHWQEIERDALGEDHPTPPCCMGGFPYCAGLVFFRGTPEAKLLVQNMISTHQSYVARTTQNLYCHEDQNPMQWALLNHCSAAPSRCRLLDPLSFMDGDLFHALEAEAKFANPTVDPTVDATTTYSKLTHMFALHMPGIEKRKYMSLAMEELHDACLAELSST